VIQLPFRNDSSSILRVQREQVWLGKISKIFIFFINGKLLRYSFSLLKFFASLPWDEILKTSYANSYYFLLLWALKLLYNITTLSSSSSR
jgi:hypothetical protein